MKGSPALKSTHVPSYESIIQRKNSLLRPPPTIPQLQLPRFYSSDQKLKKKHMIIQTEHHIPTSPQQPAVPTQPNTRKHATKYSKTEKNETPSKGDTSKPHKPNIIQEKLEEALLKRQHEQSNKSKMRQKKYDYYEILQTEKNEPTASKNTNETTAETNTQNKIRYKAPSRKSEEQFKMPRNADEHNDFLLGEHARLKTIHQSKPPKQQAKNPLKEKSKVFLRNDQVTEPVVQSQSRKEVKLRTVSTFEAVRRGRLSEVEKEHLRSIQEVIRKSIKNPTNLDHPEAYIVTDKTRFERRYMDLVEARHHKELIASLVLTRLAFYLCAHYILETLPAKPLLPLFARVQEAHEIIMSLLIGEDKSKADKYFSIQKYSSKDLLQRGVKQKQGNDIIVETTGNSFPRVNEAMRRQITQLVSRKGFIHGELFLKMLTKDVIGVQELSVMDKEMKWQVLRMPTQPFLPASLPAHRHFLILDLDETLIHFNPNREVFLVRPHAPEFLQILSKYYQLTVFTAATKEYADEIISSIDKGGYISHRLYRNHLTFLMGESLKDISMLGRPLQSTLIVDNLETNFRLHPTNGILIKSWYGADTDTILPKLQNLLIRISLEFPQDLRKGVSLYANFINRQVAERVRGYKIKYDV